MILRAAVVLLSAAVSSLVLSGQALQHPSSRVVDTALDRYVSAPDSYYAWAPVSTITDGDLTATSLDLTSQKWRTEAEVDRPIWKHWLTIIRPRQVQSDVGFLFITGGSNDKHAPQKLSPLLAALARDTRTVVSELRMVPNQPLTFNGDGNKRTEDEIIAFTWDKFLRTGEDTWPLRLPMTKSAVRAMDAVSAFSATDAGGRVAVTRFVVSGASKRAWATWTTAAVDSRVIAIIPAVIDLLNVEASFDHHYRAYGFYAPAVKDYQAMRIMDWMGSSQMRALMQIEDPYTYRNRLTMPKFIVNAAGDQFFLPDSSRFYFADLKGEKYLRYVPNTDHSLEKSDAFASIRAFYAALVANRPRPRFSWSLESNGRLRVLSEQTPTAVTLWHATNPLKRDFRLETFGARYKKGTLQPASRGEYIARVPAPKSGWTAYFVELTYPSGGPAPFKFTTDVFVTPDTLPFPAYRPKPTARR